MVLTCELELCIYHRAGLCTLSHVSINPFGMYDNAVLIHLDEEDLNYYKVRMLENRPL